jgi:hypothetical protein
MTDQPIDEESKAQADRAAEVFGIVGAILKTEDKYVVGAVLGSMLATYIYDHDLDDQMDALHRLLVLAKNILNDLNAANGVLDVGDAQCRFVYEDGTREQMESDPAIAEFVREQTSRVRQALSELQAGKYSSIDEAMQAIGLSHVDADELEEIKSRLETRRKLS